MSLKTWFNSVREFFFGRGRKVGQYVPQPSPPPPPPAPSVSLAPLALSSSTIDENSAPGTVIGSILNKTALSTVSLISTDGDRVALSGSNIVAGGVALDYDTIAPSRSFTIRETLAGALNSPLDTVLGYVVGNLNDTSPSSLTFINVGSVPLSTVETSNTITIAGMGASDSATATINGDASSQIQKNGGTWGSGPVTVINGDTIAVRHTSGSSNNASVSTTLTVGTTSSTFTSVTTPAPDIPAPTGTARFLDGQGNVVTVPIVGQPLFVDPGPFTNTPTNYDYQIYSGGSPVSDATGTWNASDPAPAFIPADAQVGAVLSVKCHAINATGRSATTSDSAFTSLVTDIDLSADTPVNTRTTASGVTPVTWDTAFGSKTFADYGVRLQVASDVGFSTITQDIYHFLSEADLVSGATIDWASDGLTSIGATQYIRNRIEASSPSGLFHASGYSVVFSPTDFSGVSVLDNFDDNSINARWVKDAPLFTSGITTGGSVTETSGQLQIQFAAGVNAANGYTSVTAASFSGKKILVEYIASRTNDTVLDTMGVGPSVGNGYFFARGGANLILYGVTGGGQSTLGTVPDPDYATANAPPVTYRWVRVRHDNATDTIKVDTAPSSASRPPVSGDWTNRISVARSNSYWNGSTNLKAFVGGLMYGAAAVPSKIIVDNFDTDMAI